jgi:hypothetical protein
MQNLGSADLSNQPIENPQNQEKISALEALLRLMPTDTDRLQFLEALSLEYGIPPNDVVIKLLASTHLVERILELALERVEFATAQSTNNVDRMRGIVDTQITTIRKILAEIPETNKGQEVEEIKILLSDQHKQIISKIPKGNSFNGLMMGWNIRDLAVGMGVGCMAATLAFIGVWFYQSKSASTSLLLIENLIDLNQRNLLPSQCRANIKKAGISQDQITKIFPAASASKVCLIKR